MAESGLAGDIEKVEKMSIWKLCDILNHQAHVVDEQKEIINQNKIKRRKKR